ncbi:MAG: hypothetical protein F6K37_15140 [Moorea sp. SIO4E2]|nr:hypothetical protein [Moorena sp. SIO4E2]
MADFFSAISYQLSAISYQLSAISYQLSAISYQLSAISLWATDGATDGAISYSAFYPHEVHIFYFFTSSLFPSWEGLGVGSSSLFPLPCSERAPRGLRPQSLLRTRPAWPTASVPAP